MTETRGLVRTEPAHRRVRAFLGGEAVVDTVDALYVWEGPHYPQWYLPLADVADGAFVPTGTETRSPSRGTGTHYTVTAGGKEAVDAAWRYADSPFEELRDRVRIGRPVSWRNVGCVVSATTTPSTSTTTWRELGRMAMRACGLRGWTNTSSSSSNQASIADQSTRTRSRSSSIGLSA